MKLSKEDIKIKINGIKIYREFLQKEIKRHERKVKGLTNESARQLKKQNELIDRLNVHMIDELCPQCDTEVKLLDKFTVQQCPNCQCPILPCGICEDRQCQSCPLDQRLKEAWIQRVMNTVYQDDSEQYYDTNVQFLNTKTPLELSFMYADWQNRIL